MLTDTHRRPVCTESQRDAGIKSVAEPEANQLHQSANQRTNQDMRSVKTVCLTNQEEFGHETNFHAFYTQQGVRNNWNHLQGYSDQEDMYFTNQRFSNPSICEYPSLEFVSSPKKKRSDPKQNVYFKIDLLSSQQAQEEEKRPRKSQDTIILIHLPSSIIYP